MKVVKMNRVYTYKKNKDRLELQNKLRFIFIILSDEKNFICKNLE